MWRILKNHEDSFFSVMSVLEKAKVLERGKERGRVYQRMEKNFKCSCQAKREVRSGEPHPRK